MDTKMKRLTEAQLEKKLVEFTNAIGGHALKGAVNFDTGFPDRLIYVPEGMLHIEVKGTSTTYHLNAKQKVWAGRIISTKTPYYILESQEQLEEIKETYKEHKRYTVDSVNEYSLNGFQLVLTIEESTNKFYVHSNRDGIKKRLLSGVQGKTSLPDLIYKIFVALEQKYPNTNYEDM